MSQKRTSLGTPPAMDSPLPPTEPEPEAEAETGAVRRTTTVTRKRADGERAPIASSLEEEPEEGGKDERAHVVSSLEEEEETAPVK